MESKMSAFEKLPREVRDMIYEHCLIYNGEIVPFPNEYEREEIERRPQVSNFASPSSRRESMQMDGQDAFLGDPHVKRGAFQTEKKSCVSGNVWRLSLKSYAQDRKYRLWETYAKYFRHVVTKFDARDVDETQLLDIFMGAMDRIEEDVDHFSPTGTANIHQEQLSLLRDTIITKRDILHEMDLKSLSFDFSNLFCSSGCCRREALQSCLISMGSTGPWYRLEREGGRDSETKPRADVKVIGLKNEEEQKLLWKTWGLKVN